LLTDAELTSMRATASEALPGSAVIQTSAYTSDGGGGGSYGWTASGTVACRIAPLNSAGEGESTNGGRISANAEYIVTLPPSTSVDTNSRLVIDSQTYNVELVRDRSWNVTTRVEVQKVV
jgi:head-tail adaptor